MYSEAVLYKMLLDTPWTPPFPSVVDRSAWSLREDHPVAAVAREVAESALTEPVPALPATLYRDFNRNGKRMPFEVPYFARRSRLGCLAIAECLEDSGRYLDAIIDLIWAMCEETTWVPNAHARLQGDTLPDVENPVIDLFSASTGMLLAETDHLLGDKLPPAVRKRIRVEARRRLTDPFLRRSDWGWLGPEGHANNWNAVCNNGVVATTLYLVDDPMVQARVIAKALASLPAYLKSFDADGCTSEGATYWGFGFGNYVMLAQLVESRTGGQVRLLDGEWFQKIAQFPVRMEMSDGKFVHFSDCNEDLVVAAGIHCWLGRRCSVPELEAQGRRHLPRLRAEHLRGDFFLRGLFRPEFILRALLWADGSPANVVGQPATAFYQGYQWLVSRFNPADDKGLVLAAKGGHNAEDHNHNDVGQVIVHLNGESLIRDLGRQVHTKEFFGTGRYKMLECRSGGHCVPVVNGVEQAPGEQFAATLIGTEFTSDGDVMELELAAAYPAEAGATSIRRRVSLRRTTPKGEVLITDTFALLRAGTFESRLHTFGRVEQVTHGHFRIIGQKATVGIYHNGAFATEAVLPEANSLWTGVLHRLKFTLNAAQGQLSLRIVPE